MFPRRNFAGHLTVAALGLAVLFAHPSAASASGFISGFSPTKVTATSESSQTLTVSTGSVKCTSATLVATLEGYESTELKTSGVAYSGCTFLGSLPATVNMNGCGYGIRSSGGFDVLCPAGKQMTISSSGCTISVPAQTSLGSLTYTNIESDTAFTVAIAITGIKYSYVGLLCGTGAATNGTYAGSLVAKGENAAAEEVAIGWEALAPPAVVVKPVGGGAKLSFVGQAKEKLKEISIENDPSGPNVPAALGSHRIQDPAGNLDETHFTIVDGGTCVIGGVINRGDDCTVVVEFKSGQAGKKANYRLKYGHRLKPEALEALLEIES